MSKIARLAMHIANPIDKQVAYLPIVLFALVILLYEFGKMSPGLFRQLLPIRNFAIPFKIVLASIVFYSFLINRLHGLVMLVFMVGYFQLEEWLGQQNNKNTESIRKIQQAIARQNAIESKPSSTIPKRIIQVWFDKGRKRDHGSRKRGDLQNQKNAPNYPAKFDKYVKSMKAKNPDYEYLFFDKDKAEAFLQEKYPHYYRTYLQLPVFIQKIDFFRYVAIYHYGGFYMDLDVQALKPLDNAITQHSAVFPIDEYIMPEWRTDKRFRRFHENGVDFLPGQYAFGAVQGHPFVKQLVDTIHRNISIYERLVKPGPQYVYSTTGPDFVADEYIQYPKKETLFLLDNGKRQMFGDYGKHDYMGTWK